MDPSLISSQVHAHIKAAAVHTGIKVAAIVGGISQQKQLRILATRPEVVVGTPGRLWDLMGGGNLHLSKLSNLNFFVIDEADRMVRWSQQCTINNEK
jgi:ATP-dependent RNA helicase DDX24/MAK5